MPRPPPRISPRVLYEDNHLLAIWKPPLLPTMGVAAGKPTLLDWGRAYLRDKYRKPGNVYLGTVSRLDAPVTGVVLFARTSKAASRLSAQFRERSVDKTYWALVPPGCEADAGELADWLVHDERHRRVRLCQAGEPGAQEARLRYRVLRRLPRATLVEVTLETGRKHQIRVQLAGHGLPVAGDRKYGSDLEFGAGIGLHARRLEVDHPTQGRRVAILAPLPPTWDEWGRLEETPAGGRVGPE